MCEGVYRREKSFSMDPAIDVNHKSQKQLNEDDSLALTFATLVRKASDWITASSITCLTFQHTPFFELTYGRLIRIHFGRHL